MNRSDIGSIGHKLDLLICAELGIDPGKITRLVVDEREVLGDPAAVVVQTFGHETITRDRYNELIAEALKPDPGSARARLAEMVAAGQITLCRAGRPVDPSEEEAQMLLDFADQLAEKPTTWPARDEHREPLERGGDVDG